ncbi:MAG TPA: hypothetical protein VIE89_35380, partial [Candidatus Binatia bacterium]
PERFQYGGNRESGQGRPLIMDKRLRLKEFDLAIELHERAGERGSGEQMTEISGRWPKIGGQMS